MILILCVTVPDQHQVPENAANQEEIPKNSYMSVAAVFVVVGSLAIGLLLLKLFQARRLRQREHPGSCPLGHTVAKHFKKLFR